MIDLNLPPGTLQKAAKKAGLLDKVSEDDVLRQIHLKMKCKQEEAMARLQQRNATEEQPESGRNSINPKATVNSMLNKHMGSINPI
jgi:hypothetical protein